MVTFGFDEKDVGVGGGVAVDAAEPKCCDGGEYPERSHDRNLRPLGRAGEVKIVSSLSGATRLD